MYRDTRASIMDLASKNFNFESLPTFVKELASVQAPQANTPKNINHFLEYLSPRNPKTGAEAK